VTQAVNAAVNNGVFYFSSAGNQGNEDDSTSGTFEGDFVPQSAASPLPTGNVHNFGGGQGFDTITSPGEQVLALFWADPLGASNNDYDLYVLDSTGATVVAASTNVQNGTQDPAEEIGSTAIVNNNQVVVFQNTGAANRFFHLELYRGTLGVSTSGETHGHSAASLAYTVAATPAAASAGAPAPNGPYPGPFVPGDQVEPFSSDGLRRIFFNADSSPITPGNFSSTGGLVLNKPDVTAADGVSVTGAGGFENPFYGTSAAAPAAASVAALTLSAKPTLTAAQMRTALTSTAIDIMAPGFDRDAGNGIVMAFEAISSLGVTGFANPELANVTAQENPGNGNGVIEAGEGALLNIQLKNTAGVQAATGITATLTSSTTGVIITQPGTSAYADMPVGAGPESNLQPFTFTLADNYPCGQPATFTLTLNYTGGPARTLSFTVSTGLLSITNSLGTALPPSALPAALTFATGTQVNRINRNGVISSCASPKAYPGAITGASHTFDSYSFNACQNFCLSPTISAGAVGVNLFLSLYSPSYDPSNIATNYAGDAGLSGTVETFGVQAAANTPYSLVVNDVNGNPPAPGLLNTYTLTIPTCAFNCNAYPLPVAVAQNVTVTASAVGGSANANVNNGSYDPNGGTLTITQTPPQPYPQGVTNVLLTVVNVMGATAQASATVTVVNPPPPVANLSSSTLMFAPQPLTTTSTPQSATITDSGQLPLHFSATPTISGANASDFAIATGSTCSMSAPVAASGGACAVSVTFKPTAAGARTATLTFADDASPATQVVTLNGIGNDFSVSGPSSAVSVAGGQTATIPITVTPSTDGFPETVTFAQSGAPTMGTTITFSPTTGAPGNSALTSNLTITTTALTSAGWISGKPVAPMMPPLPWFLLLRAAAAAVLLAALRWMGRVIPRRWVLFGGFATAVLLMSLAIAGCGGKYTSTQPNPNATPAGNSTITVTVSSGSLSHTTTVNLTVTQ
jgi:hypothetical protein